MTGLVRIPLSPGASVPRDLREWSRWAQQANAPNVRSGATGYNEGVGVFLGVDPTDGVVKFFVGDENGDKITFDGSTFAISGALDITNTVETFQPVWDGFSVDPVGTLSYIDLGAVVILYATSGITLGTSDATNFRITNLPAAITPSNARFFSCLVYNNGSSRIGAVIINQNLDNVIDFYMQIVSGTIIDISPSAFTAAGNKGITDGFIVVYPK